MYIYMYVCIHIYIYILYYTNTWDISHHRPISRVPFFDCLGAPAESNPPPPDPVVFPSKMVQKCPTSGFIPPKKTGFRM